MTQDSSRDAGAGAGGYVAGNSGRRYRGRAIGTAVWFEVYSSGHRELTRECAPMTARDGGDLGLQLVQAATRSGAGVGTGRGALVDSGYGRSYAASSMGDGRVRLYVVNRDGDRLRGSEETYSALEATALGMQLIRASGVVIVNAKAIEDQAREVSTV